MINLVSFVIQKLSAIPDITVRESYDTTSPVYPLITVIQMDNYEASQYTTIDNVERASVIPIQIDVYCRNMTILGMVETATGACEYYRMEADKIMQFECGMRRKAAPPIIPHHADISVMRAISRYDCYAELDTEFIYKR